MLNDARNFAAQDPQIETMKREAHLSAYIAEAIRQAGAINLPNFPTI